MVRVEIVQVLIILLLAVVIIQCDVVIKVSTTVRIVGHCRDATTRTSARLGWAGRRVVVELLQIRSSTVVVVVIRTVVVVIILIYRLLGPGRRKLGHVQREKH